MDKMLLDDLEIKVKVDLNNDVFVLMARETPDKCKLKIMERTASRYVYLNRNPYAGKDHWHDLDIDRVDWENGYSLFRFGLTQAGSGHPDHLIPHRMDNVNLYLKYGTQKNSVLNLIVYAEFRNQLEIDRNRLVVYDLSQGSLFIVMHKTQELWQACLFNPVLAPLMQGVFPRDRLPVINTYPAGLIANTDPHDQPGTHWNGWPSTLNRLVKVNSLTATDFLLKLTIWILPFCGKSPIITTNHCQD